MKVRQRIPGLKARFRNAAYLLLLSASMSLLTACGNNGSDEEDLAVAKLTTEEAQATNFLALNADKPGTPVDVTQYLVPGKYTIVEYFSSNDPGCMEMEPRLLKLSEVRGDIAVRTVNINRPDVEGIDWQSPVLDGGSVQTLPFFVIYDPNQRLRAKGRPAEEQVLQFVQNLPN
jgi:thiol-disulfide isomerase/thioredoxin